MKNSNKNRATNALGFERIERDCLVAFDRSFPQHIRIFNSEKILVVRVGGEKVIGNKTLGRLDFMKKYMGWGIWKAYGDDDFRKLCSQANGYGVQFSQVKGQQSKKGQSRR